MLLRTTFNRLVALKKNGDDANLNKELKKIKTGTASPIFKLAFNILSNNHKNILELVKQSKATNELDLNRYNEWPIFDFIRSQDVNKEIIKELSPPKRLPKKAIKADISPETPKP